MPIVNGKEVTEPIAAGVAILADAKEEGLSFQQFAARMNEAGFHDGAEYIERILLALESGTLADKRGDRYYPIPLPS